MSRPSGSTRRCSRRLSSWKTDANCRSACASAPSSSTEVDGLRNHCHGHIARAAVRAARNPALFPSWVAQYSVSFEADRDEPGPTWGDAGIDLPPELEHAVPKRKREFIAGRLCAREALRLLAPGVAHDPIPIGPDRAPVWPFGFIGSITHSHGFASAAVARTADAHGLGVDCERGLTEATANRIADIVASPDELDTMRRAADLSTTVALTVAFSAKEAILKCLAPTVGRLFLFRDVALAGVDRDTGRFTARVLTDLVPRLRAGATIEGRVEIAGDRFHTGVWLEPEKAARSPGDGV